MRFFDSRPAFVRLLAGTAAMAGFAAQPAHAAIDATAAATVLREAASLCTADGGALWGRSLCGPILLVDPTDGAIVANQADANGALKPSGPVFTGVLPDTEILANSSIPWSGTLWAEMLWPLPEEVAKRHVMLSHEMFHRIQPDLGFSRLDGANTHLDTLDGRMLLQLEWRALAAALKAPGAAARRRAVSDALAFRHERYRLFPEAAANEGALELNEGVAEYTGVMIGQATPEARTAYALQDLSAFLQAPTFVRTFAYSTGPAYGLLLDEADAGWRRRLVPSKLRLDELLAAAFKLPLSVPADLAAREAAYDDGTLRAAEVQREKDKAARLASWKARLVDGPVLVLPMLHGSYQFNPQTLQPLGDAGIVYPKVHLSADWGTLEVDGGALFDKAMKAATVPAGGLAAADRKGDGWRLTLKPGWSLQPGARKGDWIVGTDAAH